MPDLALTANVDSARDADGGDDATHVSIWSTAGSGTPPTGGTLYIPSVAITNNPSALSAGQGYRIANGQVLYRLTRSAETDDFLSLLLAAAAGVSLYAQWHSAAPGVNATANRLNLPRTEIPAASLGVS